MRPRTALLTLCLAAWLVGATARADEAPQAPIDPVEVGRLLLSRDEATRTRGVALLLVRIERGGDLRAFLRHMAAAQADVVGSDPEADEGETTLAEDARRVIQRLFREAEERRQGDAAEAQAEPGLAAQAAEVRAEPQAAAPEAATAGADSAPALRTATAGGGQALAPLPVAPAIRIVASVVEVDQAEFDGWLETQPPATSTGQADASADADARAPTDRVAGEAFLEAVARLPGARTMAADVFAITHAGTDLLSLDEVTYREGVVRTKTGAYALKNGRIADGLRVVLSAEVAADAPTVVRVQVRYTDVPRPMPVARVRVADDVEEIEIDVPEWRSASSEQSGELAPGSGATFTFPGVVPGKVLVIRVRPEAAQASPP